MSAFQEVFNKAEMINWNTQPVVAQSMTRSNVIRAVSRGGDTWRFEVTLPDGLPWHQIRGAIEEMKYLDRHTSSTVQINRAGYNDWLTNYQGDADSRNGFTVSYTSGNTVTLTGTPGGLSSGDKTFKAGDVIQLGSGHVYSVAQDVIYPNTLVTLNRAVIEDPGSYALKVGPDVTWTVLCVEFPQWTIFQQDQVAWGGSFVFYEEM